MALIAGDACRPTPEVIPVTLDTICQRIVQTAHMINPSLIDGVPRVLACVRFRGIAGPHENGYQ